MNVVFASVHCCIRVVKEGLALAKKGINVHFLQERFANDYFPGVLPTCSFYTGPEQYMAKLKRMEGIDIIHVHNEPDWVGKLAKQARPDIPVIFDAHDLNSARKGICSDDEADSFAMCDGFVYPSQEYMDHATSWHNVKKPQIVLHSKCIKEFTEIAPLPRMGGLVYQGGLGVSQVDGGMSYDYRDYRRLATTLTNLKVPLTLISATQMIQGAYGATGALVIYPLHYLQLLQTLSRFDWGLCASPVRSTQWDWAMPNKLFEYLAAGIPVMVYQAAACAKFVEEHKVGIVVEKLQDVPKMLGYHHEFRKKVEKKRKDFLIEDEIHKLLTLYQEVLNAGSRRAGEGDQSSVLQVPTESSGEGGDVQGVSGAPPSAT